MQTMLSEKKTIQPNNHLTDYLIQILIPDDLKNNLLISDRSKVCEKAKR
jgi:hypothetical protein